MTSPQDRHSSFGVDPREQERLTAVAKSVGRGLVAGSPWAAKYKDELISHGLSELFKSLKKTSIDNPEAYLVQTMKNKLYSLSRHQKVVHNGLRLLAADLPPGVTVRGVVSDKDDQFEVFPRNVQFRGLSLDVIAREEDRLRSLQAAAMIAVLPDPADRALLWDRFHTDQTLAELGQRHGTRSVTSVANHLAKLVGAAGRPGAVEPAGVVVGMLPFRSADVFVHLLQQFDELDILSDAVGAAIGHMQYAARFSPQHRQQSVLGVARLQYLARNLPDNRGLTHKVLGRLVRTACFYVLEETDARHDHHDPRGLEDDVMVVKAVGDVLRRYRSKP